MRIAQSGAKFRADRIPRAMLIFFIILSNNAARCMCTPYKRRIPPGLNFLARAGSLTYTFVGEAESRAGSLNPVL